MLMSNTETFNTQKAIEVQENYCKENSVPHFAPRSGRCYTCSENIYEQLHGYSERLKGGRYRFVRTSSDGKGWVSGISVEKATVGLITGCPHCSRSYCD